MASAFTHAFAALGIGTCFYKPNISKSVWIAGMLCAALPDIDSIGFRFHIPYASFWGHRGFTHSLVFAIFLALVATALIALCSRPENRPAQLFLYLFLATASHGVLDAMTNGGLGVAFFSPFSNHRYFFPFHPIQVSPISVSRFFSPKGLSILQSEFLWVWVPTTIFSVAVLFLRKIKHHEAATT